MTAALKAKLIEMNVSGITVDPFTNAPIVILKGVEDPSVALPIWIGALEAGAIAAEMEDMKFTRPMTHDLIKTLMNKTGTTVKKIEINDLIDNVYYANIFVKDNNGASHCIDSRPSDAIAIALRMDASILVSIDVLERSGDVGQGKPGPPCVKECGGDDPESLLEMLEELSPEAFGKYKM